MPLAQQTPTEHLPRNNSDHARHASPGNRDRFRAHHLERLEALGYNHLHGDDLDRPLDEVVLRVRLHDAIARRYPSLPAPSLDESVRAFAKPDGVDTLRNQQKASAQPIPRVVR